jgi:RNA ligase
VDAFIIAERGEFTIFNYVVSFDGSFPEYTGDPVRDREIGIIRECRGLTFWTDTGEIAARKFHKFFNVNQRDETQQHVIDWSEPHIVMEKLDGSMIAPVGLGEKRQWHTKMGATDVAKPVEEFVARNEQYTRFADFCVERGFTPLFEWCSRTQRIVIDYPEDNLVLLAIRDNVTGVYTRRNELLLAATMYDIPVVAVLDSTVDDIAVFLEFVRGVKGAEGFVVQFESGLMVKSKAEEYCLQHGAKEALEQEKNVWALILSDIIDDQMALMIPEDRACVASFIDAFENGIAETARLMRGHYEKMAAQIEGEDERERRKAFAMLVNGMDHSDQFTKGLLFGLYSGKDAAVEIRRLLGSYTASSSRVEMARCLIQGVRWADHRYNGVPNEA